MSDENTDSQKPLAFFEQRVRLADTKPVVWFLGFGFGGATGLALAWSLYAIWNRSPIWIAIVGVLIAMLHAAIITAFWLKKETVRRRTALMVSMVASAMLTCSLAWVSGSNGMQTGPLYGLAVMHLMMAFFHPTNIETYKLAE